MTLREKLAYIRQQMDVDVKDVDIQSVVNKGIELSQLIGLSAECKGESRKLLENARLIAIKSLTGQKLTPSLVLKMADGACAEQLEVFEYADRINAGLVHQLDLIRTVISLHKQELFSTQQNKDFQS